MNWRDLKIYQKLLISTSIILVFTAIVGLIGIVNLKTINNKTNNMTKYYLPVVNNSYKLEKYWHEVVSYLSDFNYSGNEHFSKKIDSKTVKASEAIQIVIKNADLAGLNEDKKTSLTEVNKQIEQFKNAFSTYKTEVGKTNEYIAKLNSLKTALVASSNTNLQNDILKTLNLIDGARAEKRPKKLNDLTHFAANDLKSVKIS